MRFTPSFPEFDSYMSNYSTIPIVLTVKMKPLSPIHLFHADPSSSSRFLLEMAEGMTQFVRYSMIGHRPQKMIKGRKNKIIIMEEGFVPQIIEVNNQAEFLQKELEQVQTPKYDSLPPFLGGAVGYVAYEMAQYFEPHSTVINQKAGIGAYDFHLMFYDDLIIYDHVCHELHLVTTCHFDSPIDKEEAIFCYQQKQIELQLRLQQLISSMAELSSLPSFDLAEEVSFTDVQSNFTPEGYKQVVEKVKEEILAGEIFQIVPSQRWMIPNAPDPMNVYRVLRELNPSPYMYYLQMEEEMIVGASPELLVKVTDRKIETCPIAGSRPRGRDEREDQRLASELLQDPKERAEHVMLVDLGRNDVGRVSTYGSVQVTEQMKIEKYSHVMHMVSRVTGQLVEGLDRFDAFRSCFPAGTVSGAPKIRAMEIIAEMEPGQRGVYAGAIGYFGSNGNMDTCIAIRTVYFRNGVAYLQAGGGVVIDSDPQKEYEETCHKAKAVLKAIMIARKIEKRGTPLC